MSEQLSLPVEPAEPNPNAWMFNPDGSPRKLLWCSDKVRIAWHKGVELPCPFERGKEPGGECCKDIESP